MTQTDDDRHDELEALLPWLANGTLKGDERLRLEAHVGECTDCAAALDQWRTLGAVVRSDAPMRPADAAQGFAALQREILRPPSEPRRRPLPWIAVAAAQAAALIAIVVLWLHPDSPPSPFRTLSDAPSTAEISVDAATHRLVFAEGVLESEARALLRELGASIVEGPSTMGAYGIRIADESGIEDGWLNAQRADPRVRLLEPLGPAR